MEQACQSPEEYHIKVCAGQGKPLPTPPHTHIKYRRTKVIKDLQEGLLVAVLEVFLLKVIWEKLQQYNQKTGGTPTPFLVKFVESFSKFLGLDTKPDQNRPLSTFVLTLLLTIQIQVREKVVA